MKLLLVTLLLLSSLSRAETTLVLAADHWCPYNCAPEAKQPGYLIEFAREVAKANGYQLEYRLLPWSRALELARRGEINGVVGATATNGVELNLGGEAAGMDVTVAGLRPGIQAPASLSKDLKELDPLRLGFIQKYTYDNGGIIDRYVLSRRLKRPDSVVMVAGTEGLAELLALSRQQRIDLLFENEAVLRHSQQGEAQPLTIVATGAAAPIYFGFSPNDEGRGWAAVFDAALTKAREDGSLAKLLAKYGLQPWWPNASP